MDTGGKTARKARTVLFFRKELQKYMGEVLFLSLLMTIYTMRIQKNERKIRVCEVIFMKIYSGRNFINRTGRPTRLESPAPAGNSSKKVSRNFDEITIHSKNTPDEMTFARELSKKVMKEASAPSDPQKVEEIRAQVQDGSYHIMIDEIAKKMLLG